MSAHPCADHRCDHCYVCDVLGICCASLSADQRARLEVAAQQPDEALRGAVRLDAGTVPSLGALVRLDAAGLRPTRQLGAGASSPVLALPPAVAATSPIDSRKEAAHVVVPHHPTR